MVILGIDPGTAKIGYGIIQKNGNELIHVQSGLLKIPRVEKNRQLLFIEKKLLKILKETKPDQAALEKLFFVKNQKSALAVAQARGVIVNLLNKKNIPLIELTPVQIGSSQNGV